MSKHVYRLLVAATVLTVRLHAQPQSPRPALRVEPISRHVDSTYGVGGSTVSCTSFRPR